MTAHSHDHHGHAHGHGHAGHHDEFATAFALGTALNVGFVAVEAAFGVVGNSMALLADAGHNLSDVLALLVAWGATTLARRRPSARFTYGLRGTTILAALFNALVLLVVIGGIAWEAIRRLGAPEPVAGRTVIVVAAIGIAINGLTALLFAAGRKGDINIRGAFLHMVADAAVSAGVVAAGLAILFTGRLWLDPAVSLVIAAVIVYGTWSLLRESINMSLDAVPAGIEPDDVQDFLAGLPGVVRIHDLHIWPMSTTEVALTCHLFMPGGHPGDDFTHRAALDLHDRFGIGHATLQIEISEDYACTLSEHAV
ncbi:MAG TPA: cation diffusion facilitator family transporter [Methylomirabilota bacterium]|nr:cation diffusion facilitator family transporter [Methylomirabilota bacterium]